MSFDSALSHRDDRATSGASAATASGGADSTNIMAKNKSNKSSTSTETPATPAVTNVPTTPLGVKQAAVRKAERAFLSAVDAGNDGASEREALKAAKQELAAFMAKRLPIAVAAAHSILSANGGDITSDDAVATITELRSALSGIAKPATVVVASAPAAE